MSEQQPANTDGPREAGISRWEKQTSRRRVTEQEWARIVARRRWLKVTVIALLLAAAGGAAVWLPFERQYEADAWLRMEKRQSFLAFESKPDEDPQAFFQTQIELIRSPMVLGPAVTQIPWLRNAQEEPETTEWRRPSPEDRREQVRKRKMEPDPIAWLAKQIKVSSVGGSELFRIVYSSNNPENAKKVVNAVTESYFKLRDSSELDRNLRFIDLLEKEKESWSQKVIRLRQDLREMAKRVTGRETLAPNPELDAVERRTLADLQARLVSVQMESAVLDARLQVAEEDLKGEFTISEKPAGRTTGAPLGVSAKPERNILSPKELQLRDAMVEAAVAEDSEVQRQTSAVAARETAIQDLESKTAAGKRDAAYLQLAAGLQRDRQALDRLRLHLRPAIEKRVELSIIAKRLEAETSKAEKQMEELARLRTERKTRQIMEERLKGEYDKELAKVQKAGGDTLELEFKRDELARAEKVFELIAQRTLALQTEQRAPSRVNLLRLAETPTAPVEVFPYRNVAWASTAGFCIPFVFLGIRCLIRRIRRRHPTDGAQG